MIQIRGAKTSDEESDDELIDEDELDEESEAVLSDDDLDEDDDDFNAVFGSSEVEEDAQGEDDSDEVADNAPSGGEGASRECDEPDGESVETVAERPGEKEEVEDPGSRPFGEIADEVDKRAFEMTLGEKLAHFSSGAKVMSGVYAQKLGKEGVDVAAEIRELYALANVLGENLAQRMGLEKEPWIGRWALELIGDLVSNSSSWDGVTIQRDHLDQLIGAVFEVSNAPNVELLEKNYQVTHARFNARARVISSIQWLSAIDDELGKELLSELEDIVQMWYKMNLDEQASDQQKDQLLATIYESAGNLMGWLAAWQQRCVASCFSDEPALLDWLGSEDALEQVKERIVSRFKSQCEAVFGSYKTPLERAKRGDSKG